MTQQAIVAALRWIVQEPLCHFIVVGMLMWGGMAFWDAQHDRTRHTIVLDASERAQIRNSYRQQFGQFPSREQLQLLLDRHIREEVYLREGMALHLDKDDEIVRRRVVQKYEFLQTDLALPESPNTEMLLRWFHANKARYLPPERVIFTQIFFSPDRMGDEAARIRALKTFSTLCESPSKRALPLGDPFPGPVEVGALSFEEVGRLFGQSELSAEIFKLPIGHWMGPYRSGYGWHLVYVREHIAAEPPSLAEVHEQVLADYRDEQRGKIDARNFETLMAKYTIVDPGSRP